MRTLRLIVFMAMALWAIACGKRPEIAPPAPKPPVNPTDPTDPTNPAEPDVPESVLFGSDLFEEHKDASSGVVSYLLKSGVGDWECSQSNYFVNRSMTNDGRFVFFYGSNKDYSGDSARHGMILDLKARKVYKVPNCHFSCHPYIDPVEDKLYYGYVYSNKTKATFYRRDLLVDPDKDIKLVDLPLSSIRYTSISGSPIKRLANHLTLTRDRKKVFLDMRLEDEFVYGLLDLSTGAWDEWGRAEINLTHGELNPVRDDIALMAIDKHTKIDKTVVDIELNEDGIYPRLQLVKKGQREMLIPDMTRPDQPGGYASHERWDESGQYVYWCSAGACIRNVETGEFKKYDSSNGATWASHSFWSKDREYITYDDQSLDFYRGCRWRVAFYNIKTKKMVYIHTLLPALVSRTEYEGNATTKSKMDSLHPDPHPQFVCNDKYIICTAQRPDKTIRLSITPVEQLIALTQ